MGDTLADSLFSDFWNTPCSTGETGHLYTLSDIRVSGRTLSNKIQNNSLLWTGAKLVLKEIKVEMT